MPEDVHARWGQSSSLWSPLAITVSPFQMTGVAGDMGMTIGGDVTLYRDEADVLATDDQFRVLVAGKQAMSKLSSVPRTFVVAR